MRFWSKDIPKWNLGLWVIACLLFSNPNAYSQRVNIGVPPIWHFSKKIYGAATQNWDAAQDAQNRIYFANNDGLLRYDGTRWICLPVANHTIVRSIAIDGDGRIFTGAQSEIGYFFPDERGVLSYTSLVGLLPPDQRSFEDVWDIVLHEGHAFFRTNRAVIEYGPGVMKLHTRTADLH